MIDVTADTCEYNNRLAEADILRNASSLQYQLIEKIDGIDIA